MSKWYKFAKRAPQSGWPINTLLREASQQPPAGLQKYPRPQEARGSGLTPGCWPYLVGMKRVQHTLKCSWKGYTGKHKSGLSGNSGFTAGDLLWSDWWSHKEPIRMGALLGITKTKTHKDTQRQ